MDKLLGFQFAFFPRTIDLTAEKKTRLLSELVKKFNGEQVVLPLPEDAPPEVPRLSVSSLEGDIELNVAKNRVDFFYFFQKDDVDLNNLKNLLEYIFNVFKTNQNEFLSKFGIVLRSQRGSITEKEDFEKLFNQDLLSLFLLDSSDSNFEIKRLERNIKKQLLDQEINLNRSFSIQSTVDPNNKAIIIASLDINTKREERFFGTIEELTSFVDLVFQLNKDFLDNLDKVVYAKEKK
jgi:hypothetical protein